MKRIWPTEDSTTNLTDATLGPRYISSHMEFLCPLQILRDNSIYCQQFLQMRDRCSKLICELRMGAVEEN
jgi:hypothetical protein